MASIFISASGTGIGKTLVACLLIGELRQAGYRVHALKPVASGFDDQDLAGSDSGRLLTALGLPLTQANLDRVTPWRFPAALSPDMAAARAGRSVPFEELVAFCAAREEGITLIEGVGGVMAPLDERCTVLDWIERLAVPVLLVTGSYLGTLSHTLTAAGMLERRGARLAGVIVSESVSEPVATAETAKVVARHLAPTPVVVLPRLTGHARCPALFPLIARYL
jgi:dethiobiotin synthetase